MKSMIVRNFVRISAITVVCLGLAATSFAGTNPLIEPNGLAVDASGNLYVANTGTNSILKFNSNYVQQTGSTITKSITHPTAVSVDPLGNIWVANWATNGGSITEYQGTKQDMTGTITEGVDEPLAIATDGMGDVWVQNSASYVDVYSQPALGASGGPSLQQSFNVTGPLNGIAVQENTVALGTAGLGVVFGPALSTIITGTLNVTYTDEFSTGNQLAAGGKGKFYVADIGGSVAIIAPGANPVAFITLTFTPAGIAVDKVNDRLYVSNFSDNYIQVYSTTTAQLIETIN